jgi:predicted RNA-binding Zn-ribbon protein involved in translation (DUF1610 family)
MTIHRSIKLKIASAPTHGHVVHAPPVLNASDHTIDFACGNCGTVLMHAEEGQVYNVTICCVNCGSHNSTNT